MRFSCRVTKASIQTHTQEYFMVTLFTQYCLCEQATMLPYTQFARLTNCIICFTTYKLSCMPFPSFTCNRLISSKYSRHVCVRNIWTVFSSSLLSKVFLYAHNTSYQLDSTTLFYTMLTLFFHSNYVALYPFLFSKLVSRCWMWLEISFPLFE